MQQNYQEIALIVLYKGLAQFLRGIFMNLLGSMKS